MHENEVMPDSLSFYLLYSTVFSGNVVLFNNHLMEHKNSAETRQRKVLPMLETRLLFALYVPTRISLKLTLSSYQHFNRNETKMREGNSLSRKAVNSGPPFSGRKSLFVAGTATALQ